MEVDSSEKKNSNGITRSFEIVDQLLTGAKLDKNELMPLVQNVYIGQTISSDDLKLMQLDQKMLDYLLEGNSLTIRGNETENAVCCTHNATYSFKVAEISNPLLLVSNLVLPENMSATSGERTTSRSEVAFMANCYFEIVKEKPKLQKLKNLLEMNLYCGKAVDQNSDAKKYRINDFLDTIQSSEEEIYSYLNYIEAFQIEGYWRLLDFRFFNEILDNILKLVDERSWEYDKIPTNEIYDELDGIYSLSLLKQIVNYYFIQNQEDESLYEMKKEKIVRFYSESLLRSTLKMHYGEFIHILKKSLPATFNLDFNIKQIQDICYVEEPYIYYLNSMDLPEDIEKRFRFLFEKRKKWSSDELSALIKDLCSNDITEINNALTKYCRPFTQNGVKYYSTRM